LIESFNYSQWEKKGGKTLAQRSADKVEALLATHQPEPLSAAAATAGHAIVERAAQQAA
jgi:trimethylamine:corrinoid methyltransferase-like protein